MKIINIFFLYSLFELNLDLINKNKKEEKIVVDLKKALNMMCGFTEFKQGIKYYHKAIYSKNIYVIF